MNKIILLTILLSLSTILISAQTLDNKLTLPMMGLRAKSIETVLRDIDTFIGNKPNGLHFPVSKIVFSQLENLTCFQVEGVDNSWVNLFEFGEVPYGYLIVHNRLFLIVKEGYHDIDLTSIFYLTDKEKAFNKRARQPSEIDRNPIWFFEYKNAQSYLISVTDLDILN